MTLNRMSAVCAGLGGLLWLWLVVMRETFPPGLPGSMSELTYPSVRLILLLNALVIMPLVLPLVRVTRRQGGPALLYRCLVYAQPFAALCLVLSLQRNSGTYAALLTLPWLLFTLGMALYGLLRFAPRNTGAGPARFAEVCLDAGLLYLPTGGVWLTAFQFGLNPLDFNDTWVILTAAHFHYAAFIAPIWAGLTGRALWKCDGLTPGPWRIYNVAVLIIIPGPLFTALGITFSPVLEAVSAGALALALSAVALLNLSIVLRRAGVFNGWGARVLIGGASLALIFAMGLAVLFALGRLTGKPLFSELTIAFMIRYHGWVNSAAFALPVVLGYALLRPAYVGPLPSPPFSRLMSRGPVGGDYFERNDLLDPTKPVARGLVDSLDHLAGMDFEPEKVHPLIRAFYEQTDRFELLVVPHWQKGFRFAARVYKLISAPMGQMNFPVHAETEEDVMDSRILSVDDGKDGRSNVRAWVRVYASTNQPIYAAAYSSHRYRERVYMNIAFPYLFGNMTSLLRLESWMDEESSLVELTTLPPALERNRLGDEGIYYVTPLITVRLPFNERIRVRVEKNAEGYDALAAEHDMWLLGYKFLSLDYHIKLRMHA